MGDLSMGFGAGATSIGEGGGATMEGMPSMMGGGMPMPGGMTGAAGMQMPGGVEAGPMAMQMPGAAGGPQEGAAMSKQFIEGPEGGIHYSLLKYELLIQERPLAPRGLFSAYPVHLRASSRESDRYYHTIAILFPYQRFLNEL